MGSGFTFWNTLHDSLKMATPNQSYTTMSKVKHANYFSNPLEVAEHWCFHITRVFFKIIEGFNFRPTIIVGKLLILVSQAHRRPQPGPARRRTDWAPAAHRPPWGQCAAAQSPSPAGSIGLKCLAGPLPPLFSPPAASLMIQLDPENRNRLGK